MELDTMINNLMVITQKKKPSEEYVQVNTSLHTLEAYEANCRCKKFKQWKLYEHTAAHEEAKEACVYMKQKKLVYI